MTKYNIQNLIKVDSYIEEFFLDGDMLNREYLINEIPINELKKFFSSVEDDDELYLPYKIESEISILINNNLKTPIVFDFKNFEYFLQRFGTYK